MNTSQTLITYRVSEEAEFVAHVHEQYQAEKSREAVFQHIRVFAAWYEVKFGHVFDPRNLTNYDFQLFRKHSLDEAKVKAATWNVRLWALTVLVNWLGAPDLLKNIEAKAAVRRSTKHRSLTENELHRFVHTLELNVQRAQSDYEKRNAVRNWAAASLMLQAGLRVEEVTLTDNGDVTINERSGSVLVRNGKGSKERQVPLNLSARRALTTWNEVRGAAAATVLFEGAGSERITTRTLQRIVSDIGAQCGIPDVTPHWLRYTFAKRAERNGTSLSDIADLLGHESVETTRRYLRSSLDDLMSAVEE